jgi:hypothetical protein
MRFLADESCDFAVVRALRAAGHDVIAVGESERRSIDSELIERARGRSHTFPGECSFRFSRGFPAPGRGAWRRTEESFCRVESGFGANLAIALVRWPGVTHRPRVMIFDMVFSGCGGAS